MAGTSDSSGATQWVSGDGNIVISHVTNSRIDVSVAGGPARDVALRPGWWQLPEWLAASSLAALLKPDVAIVPYLDVGGRLDRLAAWATSGPPVAVAVVAGPAGSGKTRLAGQLCRELTDDGWVAGFVRRDAQPGEISRLADLPLPRCVVVDYAEAKPDVAAAATDRLAATATPDHPIRLVLLTRATLDGSHDVRPLLRGRSSMLDLLLQNDTALVELLAAPDWAVLDTRHQLFTAAADAFANRLDTERPAVPDELARDVYDRPLTIAIAAGLACQTPAAAATEQTDLLDQLLDLEAEHWRRTADRIDLQITPSLLRLVAAYATLAGAATATEAIDLLHRLPVLADASAERCAQLAVWMHEASPGTGYWNPVEPDLIGEHLVATTIGDHPDLIAATLDNRDPTAVQQPLTLLARAAPNHPHIAVQWASIIDDRFVDLVDTAKQQAASTAIGDLFEPSLAATLAFVAAQLDLTLDTLWTASRQIKDPNLVLNPLRVAISEQLTTRHRDLSRNDPMHLPDLSAALSNRSHALSDVGRYSDALTAITEAVDHYRALAETHPDPHLPGLADALTNQSAVLANVGRHDDALTPITEAVDHYRTLAETHRDPHLPGLADALTNQSAVLADVGRHDDALTPIAEAVAIRRSLADANPGAHVPELAAALTNSSHVLARVDRPDEALRAAEEAVDVYRPLAEANLASYLHGLAACLTNLSNRLANVGRHDDALPAVSQAVRYYHTLADNEPAAYLPNLAAALTVQFTILTNVGRYEGALAAINESVDIRRQLADAHSAAQLSDLAITLSHQYVALTNVGRHQDALTAANQSIKFRRQLAEMPSDAFRPNLISLAHNDAVSAARLTRHSENLASEGRHEESFKLIDMAVRRALPALERAWYSLPDGGLNLAHTYVRRCAALKREPDETLWARLINVLRTAGYALNDEDE